MCFRLMGTGGGGSGGRMQSSGIGTASQLQHTMGLGAITPAVTAVVTHHLRAVAGERKQVALGQSQSSSIA